MKRDSTEVLTQVGALSLGAVCGDMSQGNRNFLASASRKCKSRQRERIKNCLFIIITTESTREILSIVLYRDLPETFGLNVGNPVLEDFKFNNNINIPLDIFQQMEEYLHCSCSSEIL
jgi:hypothetical protein